MDLKPDDDAPPGGDEAGAEAAGATGESADLLGSAEGAPDRPAKPAKPAKAKPAAAEPAAAPAASQHRATPKTHEVAEIARGTFVSGKWPHVTVKGPGELIELPVEDVRRHRAAGLLKDPNRPLILPTNGPRFFRDDAPGR